jgi:hypothetical protein
MKDVARGLAVEFCIGHPQLDDETHRARILPMAPETKDIWLSALPEPAPARAATSAPRPAPASALTSSWLESDEPGAQPTLVSRA